VRSGYFNLVQVKRSYFMLDQDMRGYAWLGHVISG